jgi:hypothetical protein
VFKLYTATLERHSTHRLLSTLLHLQLLLLTDDPSLVLDRQSQRQTDQERTRGDDPYGVSGPLRTCRHPRGGLLPLPHGLEPRRGGYNVFERDQPVRVRLVGDVVIVGNVRDREDVRVGLVIRLVFLGEGRIPDFFDGDHCLRAGRWHEQVKVGVCTGAEHDLQSLFERRFAVNILTVLLCSDISIWGMGWKQC